MRRFPSIALDAYWRFLDDDGWAIASHIALTALTAMFPFLIVVTALAGFLGSGDLADEATRIILDAWPAQVADPLSAEIHNVLTQPRGGLLTIGGVLAVYFASNGVEAVRVALNRAYAVRDPRPWWVLRLESIAYVIVGAITVLSISFLIVLFPLIWGLVLRFAPTLASIDAAVDTARLGIAMIVLIAALVLTHKWLPAGRRRWREIAPGVLATFVLSLAAALGFGAYLGKFANNYVTTYAGLASVMITLVFLYTLAAIFIYGAELSAAVRRGRLASVEAGKAAPPVI